MTATWTNGAREAPLCLLATEQPASAMHRGIERGPRFLAVDAFDNHGVIAHGAADEAALPRKCRGRAFAHHPQIKVAMALAPGVVVMVVHAVGDCTADNFAHALDNPLAPHIGIAASKLHCGDVTAPDLAVLVDHRRRDVHAVLTAGRLEIARRAGVAEAARAEMHPDPHEAGFVAHQVNIMIAGADGAELRGGLLPVGFHVGRLPGFGIVEQLMLDTLLIAAADAERNHRGHVPDDGADVVLNRGKRHIEPHSHVAAADIEAHTGDTDLPLISDDAADRLR